MKITIERSTLLERLAQVTKAVESRNTIPILEGVHFRSDAELTLTGADIQFSINTTLDDYVEHEAGTTLIPAKKLLEVIKKMPNKEITIETNEKSAIIKCGSLKVELPVMAADEYPLNTHALKNPIAMDGATFCKMVDGTTFSVSTNEQTPTLQGLLMQVTSDSIKAIACDRHRLAQYMADVATGAKENRQYIVPVKILEEVSKAKPATVQIWFSDNRIDIEAGVFHYTSSLLDGVYPDTSKLIPDSSEIIIKTSTESLLKTLELAEKVNEDKTKIAKFEISDDKLQVSAKDGTSGMADTLQAEVSGGAITFSANAKYLIDALKSIQTERTDIQLTGSMKPVILRGEGDEKSLFLVLPYRTTGG